MKAFQHRQDLRVKLSPERLRQLEAMASHHPARQQGETFRDYEPEQKQSEYRVCEEHITHRQQGCADCDAEFAEVQSRNLELQERRNMRGGIGLQRYWQERDEHLDRTESNALWFDNKAKTELPF